MSYADRNRFNIPSSKVDLPPAPYMWRPRSYFFDGEDCYFDNKKNPEKQYNDLSKPGEGNDNINNKKFFSKEKYSKGDANVFEKKVFLEIYETNFTFPSFCFIQEARKIKDDNGQDYSLLVTKNNALDF